jgi:hypothetical protein
MTAIEVICSYGKAMVAFEFIDCLGIPMTDMEL